MKSQGKRAATTLQQGGLAWPIILPCHPSRSATTLAVEQLLAMTTAPRAGVVVEHVEPPLGSGDDNRLVLHLVLLGVDLAEDEPEGVLASRETRHMLHEIGMAAEHDRRPLAGYSRVVERVAPLLAHANHVDMQLVLAAPELGVDRQADLPDGAGAKIALGLHPRVEPIGPAIRCH